MNNKMETTEEMEGSASLEPRKGRRDESENEEQTVCKKPRVATSDDQTDNADDGQDETAKEPQMLCDDKTEGLTDNVLQKEDETQNVEELKPDNTEQNQNAGEKDTDNEKKRQIGQNEEDDAEGKREKASSIQTGEEEGNERRKRVENEISSRETSNDINMPTGINCAAPDEEVNNRDKEVREDESKNEDSIYFNITPENTNKSEELKEVEVGDAAAKSGDKFKDSYEQPLETKDQKQKLNERITFPVGTGGDKMEQNRDVSRLDKDAEEKTQEGHSEEDNRQKGIDLPSNFSASLPTEGEIGKNDTSNRQTSPFEGTTTVENCATLSGRKSSEKGQKQQKRSINEENRLLGITQTNKEEKDTKRKKQPVSRLQKSHHGHHGHRGHHGLHNQGATCYLNSLVQVLFMTTEIHDRLKRLNKKSNSDLDRELINIFDNLKKTTSETKNITKVLGIEDVFTQRDAPECLELILHKMSPEASEIFQGKLARTTKCSEGHSIIEEINPFWTLPLSLEDTDDTTCSLERSFESFFQEKVFTGDNQAYCNECSIKTDATSECEMVKSPQILTLLLKRFDFNFNTMSYVKSHCCVEVPCELKTKDKKYKLYGMVNHIGGLYGGHYTATVLSNEDETWYECSDSHVHEVQGQPFAETGTYRSNTVYLLMYRECQRPSETNQNGDELVTIPQEPPRKRPRLKAKYIEYYLVFCASLWLVVIGLVIASFLLS